MAPTDQDSEDSGTSSEEETSRNRSRSPPEEVLIRKQERKKKTLERPVTGKHHTQYITKKGKKKQQQAQKRKRRESYSDSDHSPARKKPVSSSSHQESQRRQRVDNHPSTEMPVKTRTGKRSEAPGSGSSGSTKNAAKKAKANPKDDDSYANITEGSSLASGNTTELAERKIYQKKIDKMQKELTEYLARKQNGGKGKKRKLTDMEKLAFQTAKHQLFKKIKFSWQGALKNHTRWVMNYIQPKELQDLPQEFKVQAQDIWIQRYEDFVRQGLNDKHNDIKQEMKKVYVPPDGREADDFNPHGLPFSANLVEDLVLRIGMGDGDENQEENLNLWKLLVDKVIPKVRIHKLTAGIRKLAIAIVMLTNCILCLRLPPTKLGVRHIGISTIIPC